MATTAELQQKLTAKLRELFQLDQPDLDFGFYRVMHAKQKEIAAFLDTQLPVTLAAAFKDSSMHNRRLPVRMARGMPRRTSTTTFIISSSATTITAISCRFAI